MATPKPIRRALCVSAAGRDFGHFPADARTRFLTALDAVAGGVFPVMAKSLVDLGPGVFELALPHRGNAFRVVYALVVGDEVWVIHAFQKKSTRGIATPRREIETIRLRLSRLRATIH